MVGINIEISNDQSVITFKLRFSKTNLGLKEFLSLSLTLREFPLEDTKPRLLISPTISGERELSDICTPILPYRPFKCLSVYSPEYSLDLNKINLLKNLKINC